ncbi:membrane dipeptidase [Picrophilus oshimae]|uniref:Membrane dipeptidase n=1 Tax=Picrophilus torridus (strain ATCC 700027 / DSM 9790 / JCM 10055 / NBRC 100828 / KAW 2/3) TaxID=1122961 RepID=A0A8G2L6W2_PICTO|nr:membrane dipeptidase [Picrophilus oshimae]SMD30477.1 membrane dipeptidase [Picrophilus oshimae DSM 9789]
MEIIDLHEDLAFSSFYYNVYNETGQSSIEKLKSFDKSIIFSAVFPHIKIHGQKTKFIPLMDVMLEQFKLYYRMSSDYKINIIEDKILNGINFLISMEGTDILNEPEDVIILKRLGLRSIGLTWNYDTKFAASCYSKKDYGLTGHGEDLISICNKNNIIIDLAHASKKTILEASSVTERPVIDSHTNVSSLKNHKRNIDDESIKAITETDGVIGLTGIKETLKNGSIYDIIENINYVGDNYGWRHVSIGTDFLGMNDTPDNFNSILDIVKLRDFLGEHFYDVVYKNAFRVLSSNLNI